MLKKGTWHMQNVCKRFVGRTTTLQLAKDTMRTQNAFPNLEELWLCNRIHFVGISMHLLSNPISEFQHSTSEIKLSKWISTSIDF